MREQEGYRLRREPGRLAEHEDPETVLKRVVAAVVVDLNNFGTAELVPWMEDFGLYAIVER